MALGSASGDVSLLARLAAHHKAPSLSFVGYVASCTYPSTPSWPTASPHIGKRSGCLSKNLRMEPSVSATGQQQQHTLLPKPLLCTFVIASTRSKVSGRTDHSPVATPRAISGGSGATLSLPIMCFEPERLRLSGPTVGVLLAGCAIGSGAHISMAPS